MMPPAMIGPPCSIGRGMKRLDDGMKPVSIFPGMGAAFLIPGKSSILWITAVVT